MSGLLRDKLYRIGRRAYFRSILPCNEDTLEQHIKKAIWDRAKWELIYGMLFNPCVWLFLICVELSRDVIEFEVWLLFCFLETLMVISLIQIKGLGGKDVSVLKELKEIKVGTYASAYKVHNFLRVCRVGVVIVSIVLIFALAIYFPGILTILCVSLIFPFLMSAVYHRTLNYVLEHYQRKS